MSSVAGWLAAHADLGRLERELLICNAAGLTRVQVLSRPETLLGGAAESQLNAWAERLRRGEPLAYITGRKEFWGLELEVAPDVLIPRPETELLVELALAHLSELQPVVCADAPALDVLDLGTGSGAVAIALSTELRSRSPAGGPAGGPVWHITATDVSPGALALAARNARRLGADVVWIESAWFAGIAGRFELIVSNPPYVAADDPHLPSLSHEPRLALVAGHDGLDALRAIVAGAPEHLRCGGWLLLEHGFDQGEPVRALFTAAGFERVATLPDLAGRDRVTRGQHPRRNP